MKEFNFDNITKKSNLIENDSVSVYMGHGAQQNWNCYKSFYDFFKVVKPSRILEIGTGMGGLTISLRLLLNDLDLTSNILTYDINGRIGQERYKNHNIDARIENIFNSNYTMVNRDVILYIQQPGVTVVLCDGGNKIAEFNLLSKYIKSGDFIMAHDYASDNDYFDEYINKKLWNWWEIQDSDIEFAVFENNLEPYMRSEFQEAVWVCKRKK